MKASVIVRTQHSYNLGRIVEVTILQHALLPRHPRQLALKDMKGTNKLKV